MTRNTWIEKHRHEISGAVLDVLFSEATGGERSMRVRRMLREVDAMLGRAYDELCPPIKEPTRNGTDAGTMPRTAQ